MPAPTRAPMRSKSRSRPAVPDDFWSMSFWNSAHGGALQAAPEPEPSRRDLPADGDGREPPPRVPSSRRSSGARRSSLAADRGRPARRAPRAARANPSPSRRPGRRVLRPTEPPARAHPRLCARRFRAWSTRICRIPRAAMPKKWARSSHATWGALISRRSASLTSAVGCSV